MMLEPSLPCQRAVPQELTPSKKKKKKKEKMHANKVTGSLVSRATLACFYTPNPITPRSKHATTAAERCIRTRARSTAGAHRQRWNHEATLPSAKIPVALPSGNFVDVPFFAVPWEHPSWPRLAKTLRCHPSGRSGVRTHCRRPSVLAVSGTEYNVS